MLFIALCLLALAGCGFQLQADAELPAEMSATFVETQDPNSYLVRRLVMLLEQNGAGIVETPPASATLEIPVNTYRKEILSIGDTARVREYRVLQRVRFRLVDAQGNVLVPEQTIERSRVISFDEQDILSATREEEFYREELADTVARIMLRELSVSET